jgi:stringent starvation protein B
VFDMEDAYMIEGEDDDLSSVPPSMTSVDDTSTLPPSPKSTDPDDKAKRKNHLTVVK